MGVRLYAPNLGRFLQVDPVPGGSCTAYDYACADPVNGSDLKGTSLWGFVKKAAAVVAPIAAVAAIIPGPIGTAAALVSAGAYAVTGNWKQAAIMAGGAALALFGAGAAATAAVVATRAANIVRSARAAEAAVVAATRGTRIAAAAARMARGNRIHAIARGFTRPLERFGVRVDRAIRGARGRPDWQIGRHLIEMKRGSEAGIHAGKVALGRYRAAQIANGIRPGRGYLLTYPEKAGQWWRWRIRRVH